MDTAFVIVIGLLSVAGVLAAYRVVTGPGILDRMVGSDTFVVMVMCGLLADMAYHRHTRTLPVVLVLAMLGFVGSVAVARHVSRQDRADG